MSRHSIVHNLVPLTFLCGVLVYTFGLVGILLGPIVIGLLKAILDTITTSANWRLVETDGDALTDDASDSMP